MWVSANYKPTLLSLTIDTKSCDIDALQEASEVLNSSGAYITFSYEGYVILVPTDIATIGDDSIDFLSGLTDLKNYDMHINQITGVVLIREDVLTWRWLFVTFRRKYINPLKNRIRNLVHFFLYRKDM